MAGDNEMIREEGMQSMTQGLDKSMKHYLPSCKYDPTHKILFNYKGDNPKAGYCEECDKWFMMVEVSMNTVRTTR